MATLTMLKGIPLAYNKDMQEDKEAIFDATETVQKCIQVFVPMIKTMKSIPENMYNAAKRGFINATDLADYLTKKGHCSHLQCPIIAILFLNRSFFCRSSRSFHSLNA